MMKKYLIGALIFIFSAGAASAEIMMTADPLGKGKWSMTAGAKLDQNYFDMGAVSVQYLDTFGYGINDRLDIYATTGLGYSQKATDKPRTMDTMTMVNLGASLKYALFTQDAKRQFSMSVIAGFKGGSQSKSSMNNWQYSIGLIASRKHKLFSPYLGMNYRQTKQNYGDYSQADYTIGAKFGTEDRSLVLEDTLQIVDFAGNAFQSNQFALGVCIGLN